MKEHDLGQQFLWKELKPLQYLASLLDSPQDRFLSGYFNHRWRKFCQRVKRLELEISSGDIYLPVGKGIIRLTRSALSSEVIKMRSLLINRLNREASEVAQEYDRIMHLARRKMNAPLSLRFWVDKFLQMISNIISWIMK